MTDLKVRFDNGIEVVIELRKDGSPTLDKLRMAVPFSASANRWGDEIYFETPVSCAIESDARAQMEVGEVAYWPDGRALAIFFGRTPVSTDERPMAYSPCNIVGSIKGDPSTLRSVQTGATADLSEVGED
ncbi:MAG: hypothetical protein JSV94_01545 [Methanobacteriota archaeon]|nr:MAG: hypothetical protein JSV94_01545 [Euryarchaeota archaeon]